MSLDIFDSARKYVNSMAGMTGMILGAQNIVVSSTLGRDGGPTFTGEGLLYATRTYNLGATIIIGMHVRWDSFGSGQRPVLQGGTMTSAAFVTSGQQWRLRVDMDAGGTLQWTTGTGGTVRATSVLTLNPGTNYFIEVKVTLQTGATGTLQVKVDGIDFIGGSSSVNGTNIVTTGATGMTRLNVGSGGTGTGKRFDVFYLCDNTGSVDNDFLGNVTTVKPAINANSSVQFTPSAGANYQCVDENPANDDTDYNHSDTVGHKDLFSHAGGLTGTILGVQCHARVKKETAGTTGTKQILSSGGTEVKTALAVPPLTYNGYWQIRDTDPLSGVQITASEANAMLVGYENTITP